MLSPCKLIKIKRSKFPVNEYTLSDIHFVLSRGNTEMGLKLLMRHVTAILFTYFTPNVDKTLGINILVLRACALRIVLSQYHKTEV